MSPLWAAVIVTWVGLGLLYLAMVRLLVEIQTLRRDVAAAGGAHVGDVPPRTIPPLADQTRLVIVADRECQFCRDLVALVASRWPMADFAVLVHQEAEVWRSEFRGAQVVTDLEAWKSFAPLSTPILVARNREGKVGEILPPANLESASRWLSKHEMAREKVNDDA